MNSIDKNCQTSLNRTRSTEWLLAICAIGWGAMIVQPAETFDVKTYNLMKELMREPNWGSVAIIIGILRCMGLGINGLYFRSPILRGAGSLMSGLFWLSILVLMMWSSRRYDSFLPPGVIYYPIFFVFEGWCVYAAAYDMQKNKSFSYSRRVVR